MCMPFDPTTPHLETDPSKILIQVNEDTHTSMFTKAWFVIMKNQKQLKCPTNRDVLSSYVGPLHWKTRQLLKMRKTELCVWTLKSTFDIIASSEKNKTKPM